MTIELLSYLPLIDLNFSQTEAELIMGSNQFDSVPEVIPGFECIEAKSRKSSYNFECSNLLKTAQKELALIVVMFLLKVLAKILEKYTTHRAFGEKLMKLQQKIGLMISFRMSLKVLIFIVSSRELPIQSVASWMISVSYSVWLCWQLYRHSRKAFTGQWDTELKPSRYAQLFYSCLLLYRVSYASLLILMDSPVVQLSVLASVTTLVSITQLLAFALVVRPFVEVKLTFQFVGMLIVVVYFITVLFLMSGGSISNSFISQGFIIASISLTSISILILLVGVSSKVLEFIRIDVDCQSHIMVC